MKQRWSPALLEIGLSQPARAELAELLALLGRVLFVEDRVVYTLHGGQPRVHDKEVTRNPLGPLQGWSQQVTPRLLD